MDIVTKIAQMVKESGGTAFYVGGYPRDLTMGLTKESKDIDIEVHGIDLNTFKEILSSFGRVNEVGASFGVLKIHGLDIDFSLPRREILAKVDELQKNIIVPTSLSSKDEDDLRAEYADYTITINPEELFGHRDFAVVTDPYIGAKEASTRRDFTINAIMINVLTGEVLDFWQGVKDIEIGVIRHISDDTFWQDALRVLRACQFAARFEYTIAPETQAIIKSLDLTKLAKERIYEELMKGLLKAKKPSLMFEWMRELAVVDQLFPELQSLINCPHDPIYHPEGDVWVHTMKVIDRAAILREQTGRPDVLMLSALCHDLGKPITSVVFPDGRVKSHGHAEAGVPISIQFLKRMTEERDILDRVSTLVRQHMRAMHLYPNGTDKAIRKLAAESDLDTLLLLTEADVCGVGFEPINYDPIRQWWDDKINSLHVDQKFIPVITGNDLINEGLRPGKIFAVLLNEAKELQFEGLSKELILHQLSPLINRVKKGLDEGMMEPDIIRWVMELTTKS